MNPWTDKLGCEVNVCCAKVCNAERMKICALRKAYQERVAYLRLILDAARGDKLRGHMRTLLAGLGIKKEAE